MALAIQRSDLQTMARKAVAASATDPTTTDRINRAIERALNKLARDRGWESHQETIDVTSVAPYTTGTAAVSTTAVTGTGTTFGPEHVGQFIEFNAERHWYEITAVGGATSATLRSPGYLGDDGSDAAYKIIYAKIDCPANFFSERARLIDPEENDDLEQVRYSTNTFLQAQRVGVSDPEAYSIIPKRHDPNQWQLLMYPAPQAAKPYILQYYRKPGWFDTNTPATSTWYRKADDSGAGGDDAYVDWPADHEDVLEAAILYYVAKELKPDKMRGYLADYMTLMENAADSDRKMKYPTHLGRSNVAVRGDKWTF